MWKKNDVLYLYMQNAGGTFSSSLGYQHTWQYPVEGRKENTKQERATFKWPMYLPTDSSYSMEVACPLAMTLILALVRLTHTPIPMPGDLPRISATPSKRETIDLGDVEPNPQLRDEPGQPRAQSGMKLAETESMSPSSKR